MFEFNLEKKLQDNFYVNVNFKVKEGQITTLIGKSGEGKSTILNLISGSLPLDKGWVRKNNFDYTQVPVHLRKFGYIQQQSYLFKHLTLLENITYSGNRQGLEEYLEFFELKSHLSKKVNQLSGGEAQRVSIVRTLMSNPQLLLIDEGFNAIDLQLRSRLKSYLKELNMPIIFVTHDLGEAYEISDQILVVSQGKIIEKGTCEQVFYNCKKLSTARLLGVENIYNVNTVSNIFNCPKKCCWVGIKGNQISIEKEGYLSTIKAITYRLDNVILEIILHGLDKPLLAVLSRREYTPWEGKSQVYIKINHMLFLEE